MITKAAVKIWIDNLQKEIIIPCHRHSDAYQILHEFGYKPREGYRVIEEGFLDEDDNFLDRVAAKKHAIDHHQLIVSDYSALYSEDLW